MKCVICRGDAGKYGHNPAPVADVGRCCTECFETYVAPIRGAMITKDYDTAFWKTKQVMELMLRNQNK